MFCFMLRTPDGSWLTDIDAKSWDEVPESIARYYEDEFGENWTKYCKNDYDVYEVVEEKKISMVGQKEKAEKDYEETVKNEKEKEERKLYVELSKKYGNKSIRRTKTRIAGS